MRTSMKSSDKNAEGKSCAATSKPKPLPHSQAVPAVPLKGLGPCGCGCGGAKALCRGSAPALESETIKRQLDSSRQHQSVLALQRLLGNHFVNRLIQRQAQTPEKAGSPQCGLHEEGEDRVGRTADHERPRQGSATIECDGSGGYRVDLGGWAGAPCGIEGCVTRHEQSHISDWQGRWPNGCKNADGSPKPAGYLPMGGPGYADFLRRSECSAYTVEEACITPLLASARGNCRQRLRTHLADTRSQKAHYCS